MTCSVTGRNAWLGHALHLVRGLSQMLGRYSLLQAGE